MVTRNDSSAFLCRDCEYDLRATTGDRCPEFGLKVERSRSFQGYAQAGPNWTKRAIRRLAWSASLCLLGIVSMIVAASAEVLLSPLSKWMFVLNYVPFLAFAGAVFSLCIPSPNAAKGLSPSFVRAGRLLSVLIVLGPLVEYWLIRLLATPQSTRLIWMLVGLSSALQASFVVAIPALCIHFARRLPSSNLTRILWVLFGCGMTFEASLILNYALLVSQSVSILRIQMPLQIVMVVFVLTALVGSIVVLFILRSRVASQYRKLFGENETARRV